MEPVSEVIPVPVAAKSTGPKMMMFDPKKPIANAPDGTIKVTSKSELIPMSGSPIPSENKLEL